MKRTTIPAGPNRKPAARLSRRACLLALGGALAATCAATAQAQIYKPFGSTSGPALTQEDYKIATATVVKLLNEKPAEAGRYETWSNPASGNHGKFTILSLYTMDNMPCRKVTSTVVYNSKIGLAPRSLTLGACQIPSGAWKTAA